MEGRWIIPLCFDALLVLVAIIAWRRGGSTEREGAAIVVLGTIATLLASRLDRGGALAFQPGLFAVDLLVLTAFCRLMIRSDRFWPLWSTAFQLLSTASGLGPIVRGIQGGFALGIAFDEQIWSWLIILQLGIVSCLRSNAEQPSIADAPDR